MPLKVKTLAVSVLAMTICVVSDAENAIDCLEFDPAKMTVMQAVQCGLASSDEMLIRRAATMTDSQLRDVFRTNKLPETALRQISEHLYVLSVKAYGLDSGTLSPYAVTSPDTASDRSGMLAATFEGKMKRFKDVLELLEPGASEPGFSIETPGVAKPRPDPEYEILANPYVHILGDQRDEPEFKKQCGLTAVNAEEAWKTINAAPDVKVAIVDSGLAAHPDLEGYSPASYDDIDRHGHGTHVAGIIGALQNGTGVIGVTWKTNITAYKFLDGSGRGTLAGAVEKIRNAIDDGAHVIVLPWGAGLDLQELRELVTNATGVLFVAAAGNSANDISDSQRAVYPAAYNLDNLISVMATTCDDRVARFSNFSKSIVDLAAPGEGFRKDMRIFSTVLNQTWGNLAGTSMSAAFVAGAAALVRQRSLNLHPDRPCTPQQIKTWLNATVTKLTDLTDKNRSKGRLDLAKAVKSDPCP